MTKLNIPIMFKGYARSIDLDAVREFGKANPIEIPNRAGGRDDKDARIRNPAEDAKDMRELECLLAHLERVGERMIVEDGPDGAVLVRYDSLRFMLPASAVDVEPCMDEATLEGRLLPGQGGGQAFGLVLPEGTSLKDLEGRVKEAEDGLRALNSEEKKIRDVESEGMADIAAELAALQARIKERQEALLAELAKKREEMEAAMEGLRRQVLVMETKIYGIRCYLGEAVTFHTVRDGRPAGADVPVILYQKLRFLDEEFGRILAIDGFWDEASAKSDLLTILESREDIVDMLAPGPRSISVAKASRTGKVKGHVDGLKNVLRDYDTYHKNQLLLLVRDGERLHIAWMDSDKVMVSDDNMFLTPKSTEVPQDAETEGMPWYVTESDRERYRAREERRRRDDYISRWFLFVTLQGLLDNTDLMGLPKGTSIMQENGLVVFSSAKGWLGTSGYGTFKEMLQRSRDIPYKEGDHVLTIGGVFAEHSTYSYNDRGIGPNNRTGGTHLPPKTVLPVNKVLPGLEVRYTARLCRARVEKDPQGRAMYRFSDGSRCNYSEVYMSKDGKRTKEIGMPDGYEPAYRLVELDETVERTWTETFSAEKVHDFLNVQSRSSYKVLTTGQLFELSRTHRSAMLDDPDAGVKPLFYYRVRTNIDDSYGERLLGQELLVWGEPLEANVVRETGHQYYCQTMQDGYKGQYPVNLQFYESEVIPVDFLCRTWIRDVIRSGHVGDVRLCGTKMSFADLLPYLHVALGYVKGREEGEKELLTAAGGGEWVEANEDWDAVLLEWRLREGAHRLTKPGARKFLRGVMKACGGGTPEAATQKAAKPEA